MKIFTFILSIYITALSIAPCADCMPQNSTDISGEVFASEHNHTPVDNMDCCTPFCVCACCGSLVVMPYLPTQVKSRVNISTFYFLHYNFDYNFDYIGGVWRPPSYS